MAMQMRMNPTYGLVPMQAEGVVSFTDASFAAATVNRQVLTAQLTVNASASNNGTLAFLGSDATLKPTRFSQPFNVFCNPNGSAAGATGNAAPLPLGLATGGVTTGSEYVLDFSAYASDITGAQAGLIINARNTATVLDAYVSVIDNVNKLVYVNIVNSTTGALAPNVATYTVVVDVQFVENGYTV